MADVIAKEAVKIIASTFDDLINGELTEDDREKNCFMRQCLEVLSYRKQKNNGGTRNGLFAYIFQKISTTAEQTDCCSVSLQSILKEMIRTELRKYCLV